MSKYERFVMEPRESIQEMFTRFTNITNELVSLGRIIPTDEQVRKILRSLPQDERWRAKVTAIQESKDFTKFNLEELAGSLMTHELHLGTADSSRNKGLALAAGEQDESECDEEEAALLVRKFKKFFRNSRYANQRNNKERRTKNLECHKCGSTEHFIKDCPTWKNEKGKGKTRDSRRPLNKENFNKTDFRKAMIAAWGETESENETIVPEEEETANLCLMATHKGKEKQVNISNSFSDHSFNLSKNELKELLKETQVKFENCNDKCLKLEQELKVSKDHVSYINTFRHDVQNRFFGLLDQNIILKENMERLKKENVILNIELSQYKLLGLNEELIDASTKDLCNDFQYLKMNSESNRNNNNNLELNSREKGKIKITPKWILDAKSKKSQGLKYFKNNKSKKAYVDLPRDRYCTFCGKAGHLKEQCTKREQYTVSNRNYVDNIQIDKYDSCKIDKEPKKVWVPIINN